MYRLSPPAVYAHESVMADPRYKARVDPFIGVLLEYTEEPLKETRKPFPKATPGGPHTPRDPQMNR